MKRLVLIAICLSLGGTLLGASLKIVKVTAPAINCKFSPDCKVTVQDMPSDIIMPGSKPKGFLQSRTFEGKPGTVTAGMHAYLYRIDLTALMTKACVAGFTIDFGPVKSIDFDGDGSLDQVFVVTSGGLGTAGPVSATQTGKTIRFSFQTHPCSGESSFFFGLVSAQAPTTGTAKLTTTSGAVFQLKASAPIPAPPVQPTWEKKKPGD